MKKKVIISFKEPIWDGKKSAGHIIVDTVLCETRQDGTIAAQQSGKYLFLPIWNIVGMTTIETD